MEENHKRRMSRRLMEKRQKQMEEDERLARSMMQEQEDMWNLGQQDWQMEEDDELAGLMMEHGAAGEGRRCRDSSDNIASPLRNTVLCLKSRCQKVSQGCVKVIGKRLIGDKGYISKKLKTKLMNRGCQLIVPRKKNQINNLTKKEKAMNLNF